MIVLALGKKGSGKTTLLRKLVFRRLASPQRPLVFWHDPGVQIADEAGRVFTSVGDASALAALGALPQLCIFRGVDVEAVAALALKVKDVTLVIDELDRAFAGKSWRSESVRRIVHEGRHERVDLFGTFRSTRNVGEDLLGQADVVFLLRHSATSYYDLQTITNRFGPTAADAAQALDPGQFIAWADW